MLAESDLRVEAVAQHARLVEHERDAAGEEAAGDAPRLAELTARIGEQRERQAVMLLERGVRGSVVARYPDHVGTRRDEVLVGVAKRARFDGAAEGLVLWIEVDDKRLAGEL